MAGSCRAEGSAWWATAVVVVAVVLVAEQTVARPAGTDAWVEVASAEIEEDPGLGLLGLKASAGCRECVKVSQAAPDWQTEDGRRFGERGRAQTHLQGR